MADRLLSIDQARAVVLDAAVPLGAQTVPIDDALGRWLAEDVVAQGDVPPFDNSAMDGFIVAPGEAGRTLAIAGESRAGAPADAPPGDGEALRVSTGAVVPRGDTGVIPVEQVDERDGAITTRAATERGRHVRRAGEDVRAGQTVLRAGRRLGPAELGVAVIAGCATLQVARRPRVAIVATGDELRPPGAPLGPGEIHESNAVTLAALARQSGANVVGYGAEHGASDVRAGAGAEGGWHGVADTPEATREALSQALDASDVVIASGGVSVGPHDHVKPALDALGVRERFWRVALRPGKPTWFGTRDGQLVFGLPGNPVSAMVTFLLFARPALVALQGGDPQTTRATARLTEAVTRTPGRDEAVRVRLTETDAGRQATPTGPQGSHQLTSMLGADGLAILPAGDGETAAGAAVTVELLVK